MNMQSGSAFKRAGIIKAMVRFMASFEFGIAILILILIYACLASALPQLRGAVEMTEMQIFRHWIFGALIALMTLSLLLATLSRVAWRWVNAGTFMVHAGMLLMVGGAVWYFASKTEGDVVLNSPRVELIATSSSPPRVIAEFLAEQSQSWSSMMPAFGGTVGLEVQSVAQDASGVPTSAEIKVTTGGETPRIVKVVAGEADVEIMPKALALRLTSFPPEKTFYDQELAAIYVRPIDAPDSTALPIDGLPIYRERYFDEGYSIVDSTNASVPSKRVRTAAKVLGLNIPTGWLESWRMPIDITGTPNLPFDMRVTGYLPYISRMAPRAVAGSGDINPAVNIRLEVGAASLEESLFARDKRGATQSRGLPIEFRWTADAAERDASLDEMSGTNELYVEVKNPPVVQRFSIIAGQKITVPGTDYELTIKDLQPDWPMLSPGYEGASSPMASVDVQGGGKEYNRTVIQRFPELSQDIDEAGTRHREGPYDSNLIMRYRAASEGRVLIVAGPGISPVAGVFNSTGTVDQIEMPIGQSCEIPMMGTKVRVTLLDLMERAERIDVPVVEPLDRRRPNLGPRAASAIRVQFNGRGPSAGRQLTRWISFSQYPHVDARSIRLTMPGDPREWEVTYSRMRHDLGVQVVPGKLSVKFFPGRQNVESWRSDFRVLSPGDNAPKAGAVYTNQTYAAGGWTFFQSGAAGDHWSYTILGVGNRNGINAMLLGCVLITLGALYAFYVKPIIRRRMVAGATAAPVRPSIPARTPVGAAVGMIAAICLAMTPGEVRAANEPFSASQKAAELDKQIDWNAARLIAVQDDGRYKTLDSFARESLAAMFGKEHFPSLSPMASLMEWLFNSAAYEDAPVVFIKDRGVRIHLSAHMSDASRQRIRQTGYMTPRELRDPIVGRRVSELEPLAPMVSAMRRVRNAETVAFALPQLLRMVPSPEGDAQALWHTIDELKPSLPAELRGASASSMGFSRDTDPIAGMSQQQAVSVMAAWAGLWQGWMGQDAAKVQQSADRLAELLPSLAGTGVYPSIAQRKAEASYYAWGKYTWVYWIYVLGGLIAVPALITRWRAFWVISLTLLLIGMSLHAWGIGQRWMILGRIPVANMFEALTASAWVGMAVALIVELVYKTRVALLGAHAAGFLALLLAGYVVPGGGTITIIMGILDDVMLRIHTVLIISSYALIFVASIIAVVYLFGYYFHRAAAASTEVGGIALLIGLGLWIATGLTFQSDAQALDGVVKNANMARGAAYATAAMLVLLMFVGRAGMSHRVIAPVVGVLIASAILAIGDHGFCLAMAWTMTGGGLLWALGNAAGLLARPGVEMAPAARVALAGAGAGAGGSGRLWSRPIAAGALPVDSPRQGLPEWLHQIDWSHLIILNLVFVMLFVGTILGAVWADYSWGRPWGWDPKEVFALNTWIIYAILIHLRYVTRNKGLWTAWCSIGGCLMMIFNWCFVNFYIVGLHSYA